MNKKLITAATPGQREEIDKLMNEIGITATQMMELAGKNLAKLTIKKSKGPILIFCGKGHNGGVGLCATRHLMNRNIPVAVILVESEKRLGKEEKQQLNILKHLQASIFRYDFPDMQKITSKANLIIDALLGYKLRNDPEPPISKAIEFINKQNKKVLSIDISTGIDGLTGESYEPSIKGSYTLALGIPLKGIINNKNSGKLYIADIGIPDKIYAATGLEYKPQFQKKEIIKL